MFGDLFLLGLAALACILAGPVAFFMAMSNRRSTRELRDSLTGLRLELQALRRTQEQPGAPEETQVPVPPPQPAAAPVELGRAEPPLVTPPRLAAAKTVERKERQTTLERQFGGRAFVWLGGIALALSGFFLVKYSIDTGLLTEDVRVVLGVLFGLALLAGSHAVRTRQHIADGTRIAQALAGAGIADLYGSLFAATTLYHLVPAWLGFGCMALVTLTALILSLRNGAPIAALGLLGGYATPLMVAGEPNAPLLFAYLYLVFGGLSLLIRRQNWQWLAIPATLVAFGWVGLWLFDGLAAHDGAWLSLFLLGVAATAVVADHSASDIAGTQLWLRYLAPAGSLVLMAGVAYASHFGTFEWAMFGLISAGAILLAWFDDHTYALVPWLAFAANVALLLGWYGADPVVLAGVILAFALLFIASGQYLLTRSANPVSWAGLSAAAALGYFLLAYDRLNDAAQTSLGKSADAAWEIVALAVAALLTFATTRSFVLQRDTRQRHVLQSIFAATATALVSAGFAILLHQEFLPFAIAAEVLALSAIGVRVDIPALRAITLILAVIYAALVIPDALSLSGAAFDQILLPPAQSRWHAVADVLFRFAAPGLIFASATPLLRRLRDDKFVTGLELAAIALVAVTVYKLVAIVFSGHPNDEALLIRGIVNDVFLLVVFACLTIARNYARPAILWGGVALGGLVLARIAGYDLFLYNPLWSHEAIGALPLLNVLLPAYGLPAASGVLIARDLARAGRPDSAWGARIAGYVLGFVYVSFNVRQIFGGNFLDTSTIGNAEVYTYSAVWLAGGVALLFAAVLRKDFAMRVASLVVMLLTVGKVFLYDASALSGLWRVVSFLGLGVCLLTLSWFYSRFVFTAPEPSQ